MQLKFADQFIADLETGELFHNGRRRHLPGKPFRLLALLLRRSHRMVRYKEIERYLWPDTHVAARNGIKEVARKVRAALGQRDAHAGHLQCLRNRGYRLMVSVSRSSSRDLQSQT